MEQMSLRTQSSLDVTDDALRQISAAVTKLVAEYVGMIGERPVRAENYAGKTTESIDTELSADGVPLEQLLAECRTIMDLSRHNGHPRFFGYVASPSTPIGAYGDLIASALNANITCWRSGPAGTEVERLVVRWLGSLIGYDEQANGLLTSGGSMANMIALLIASRRRSNVSRKGLWNSGSPMTVYASEEVHMSISKAADILGIGRDQVRTIACDERQRMRVDVLRHRIEADLNAGLRPFCVVWWGVRELLTRASLIRSRRSQMLRVSFNFGFTSMGRTARPVFWMSGRNICLRDWSARIPCRSIRTSGFTFRLMQGACCFVTRRQRGQRSAPRRRITFKLSGTLMKKRLRFGIMGWSCRDVSGR